MKLRLPSCLLALLLGCSSAVQAQPLVVVTNPLLQSLTQEVADNLVRVETLVPPRTEVQGWEPDEEAINLVRDAKLLIANGASYEPWLADLQKAAGYTGLVVLTTDRVSLYDLDGELHEDNPDNPEAASQLVPADLQFDPYAWMDPRNAIKYVENIRNGLDDILEGEARRSVQERADALLARIRALHGYAETQFAVLRPFERVLVTPYISLNYFAKTFNFKVVPIPGLASGQELRPALEARLVDTIRRSGAPAVFFESTANTRVIRRLATETGVNMVTSLHITEPAPSGPASGYVGMFRANVETIVNALRDPNDPAIAAAKAAAEKAAASAPAPAPKSPAPAVK